MIVRRAVADDAPQVWPLVRSFATSFVPEEWAFTSSFARLLGQQTCVIVVAVEEPSDAIIGYLVAHLHGTLYANAPLAWIEELMVDESSRRSGVGQALVAAAEQWARDHDAAYIALATRRADAFYAELDYDESATFFRKLLP